MSTDLATVLGRRGATVREQGSGLREQVHVNQFYGGRDGVCNQITIGNLYVQLDAAGREALIAALCATETR